MTVRRYIDVRAALDELPQDPEWSEAVLRIARVADWTEEEAESRLLAAIADGDVTATLDGEPPAWHVHLSEGAE